MADYTQTHSDALTDVSDAGASITFTSAPTGTYTASTDSFASASATTVSGYAVEMEPDQDVYDSLSLVQSSARTLFFIPTTYGDLPKPGYTTVWGGKLYTVRAVDELAPDGTAIGATVVVSG